MTNQRDVLDYLTDIAAAIDAAQAFVADMTIAQFRADQRTVYAVAHALEIVGEAAKRIPKSVRGRYPAVPWRLMAGMRDRIEPAASRWVLTRAVRRVQPLSLAP